MCHLARAAPIAEPAAPLPTGLARLSWVAPRAVRTIYFGHKHMLRESTMRHTSTVNQKATNTMRRTRAVILLTHCLSACEYRTVPPQDECTSSKYPSLSGSTGSMLRYEQSAPVAHASQTHFWLTQSPARLQSQSDSQRWGKVFGQLLLQEALRNTGVDGAIVPGISRTSRQAPRSPPSGSQ